MFETMTTDQWIAWGGIVLPLCVKVLSDVSARAEQRKQNALSRITGMAARGAADAARTLQELPPGADKARVEAQLLKTLTESVSNEMATSAKAAAADPVKIGNIVSGEFNKIAVVNTPAPVLNTPAAVPPSATGTTPWTDAPSSVPPSLAPLPLPAGYPVATQTAPIPPAPSAPAA